MRSFMLLIASCVFYMAFIPAYILILFMLILIDYYAAIWMERSEGEQRRVCLIVSIVSTCLVLFIFKYFNFFNGNIASAARLLHLNYPIGTLQLILPIGLSFHTFQSLSYVIEVYKKRQEVEHDFWTYALYVMFYPQLVAGPIERPQNLLHQFHEEHVFDYQRVADGLKLMAWGMFKKVVIADRLAAFVKVVYDDPHHYQGISFIVATIFFAFQIYCDFSGYSDIAIGSAQVMGFRLMDNFNRPYFSKSIAEFWKRWHISLSSWFRDYVYIPLGGKRVDQRRWFYNLFITFLISGLWHGANWTYIVWGALNGFYVIFGIVTKDIRMKVVDLIGFNRSSRWYRNSQVLMTFMLVCFAWIFFRSKSIQDAFYISGHMFSGVFSFCVNLLSSLRHAGQGMDVLAPITLGQGIMEFFIAIASIIFLLFVHLIQRHGGIRHMLSERPGWLRWTFYCSMGVGIIVFGYFKTQNQFIYFQF